MAHRLRHLLALWFGVRLRVGRRAYALTGFSLAALKYAVDAAAVHHLTGQVWLPHDYLSPLLAMRLSPVGVEESAQVFALLAWSLPFAWIGVSMTVRRALDAGLSGWTGLVFFVPLVSWLWMLALCLLPSRQPEASPEGPSAPRAPLAQAAGRRGASLPELLGAVWPAVALGFAVFLASVMWLDVYGATLFAGTPFAMGFVAAWRLNRPALRAPRAGQAAALLALLLVAGTLLLFAFEGVVCLAMAFPIALVPAALGAVLGREVAAQHARPATATRTLALLLALPAAMGAERAGGPPPVRAVASAVEIAAPPEVVWARVVGFSELPPPARLVFAAGIAHPVRARIEGTGVGAIRHCEFSTGAFVEPITAWEPPARLAFDVRSQPEPMEEWSPYRHVNAPHLVDGLRSRRGEFRLIRLAGGRTRLEGRTWYTVDMSPQPYWGAWSDLLIHAIHARVLEHVKRLAESDARAGARGDGAGVTPRWNLRLALVPPSPPAG